MSMFRILFFCAVGFIALGAEASAQAPGTIVSTPYGFCQMVDVNGDGIADL